MAVAEIELEESDFSDPIEVVNEKLERPGHVSLATDELFHLLESVRELSEEQLKVLALKALSRDPTLIQEISLAKSEYSPFTRDQYFEIQGHAINEDKVEAIKSAREFSGWGLRECKKWVESEFGGYFTSS